MAKEVDSRGGSYCQPWPRWSKQVAGNDKCVAELLERIINLKMALKSLNKSSLSIEPLIATPVELTTHQAADLLNFARSCVVKLLKKGKCPVELSASTAMFVLTIKWPSKRRTMLPGPRFSTSSRPYPKHWRWAVDGVSHHHLSRLQTSLIRSWLLCCRLFFGSSVASCR